MIPAVPAQVVQHPGCALGDLAADGGFAVQDAHGVFLQTLPAGLAQLLPAPLEIRPQRLVVFRPAGGAADGIDGKGQVLQPQNPRRKKRMTQAMTRTTMFREMVSTWYGFATLPGL